MNLFAHPGPRWFNIPAHRPFVQDLAAGLYDALTPLGPDALSQAIILTPTRRGARALADAFIAAAGGKAVLPPQIRPLGDLDEGEPPFEPGDLAVELPAAIGSLRRRFELTRLVKTHEKQLGRELDASAALELADALGSFLDSLQIEEVSGDGLAELVGADLAEHWRISREFLEMAQVAWPARLAELGLVDVSQRRVALLRKLAQAWTDRPPQGVLIAAGSTGTAPATADLLAVVAAAPQGAVVLPGLDDSLAESAWIEVGEQHPQGAMRRLLHRAGIERRDVMEWPASFTLDSRGRWRRRVINEALRPAERTADWLSVIEKLREEGEADGVDAIAEGLSGLSVVTARAEEEAATAAALLLREALETPGRTAALVAPDQALARRVAAKLARWGVAADSSAGLSLSGCAGGVLAGLVAKAAIDPLDPVTLLAILKHPLVRLGLDPEHLIEARTALEREGLRGPRCTAWPALEARLSKSEIALSLSRTLQAALSRLEIEDPAQSPADAARRLTQTLEALAVDPLGDHGDLWAGHGGEALGRLLAGLIDESEGLPHVTPRGFADLFARLMAGESVRTGGSTHPRLRILGAIEARLTRADRLVVAGLEEGVWPQGAPLDPFLSRPMRERLGLPPPERRVGLAAHDFAQAACAPEVILLHSERREGAPAVKSRWLWRLETLARGAGVLLPGRPDVIDWARALDAAQDYKPARRPSPNPPIADRPRVMAVTRIEALTRDPYAVWARDILKLFPLERPDEAVEARARGTAIHKAFERLAEDHPDQLPPDAAAIFEGFYVAELEAAGMPHEALARETALAKEAAAWVADLERRRRADGRSIHVELKGELTIEAPAGPFTVNARADRIEIDPQGYGHILDYKTGKAPSKKVVETGFSPQLTLTAAILQSGGFPTLGHPEPGELTYLEITGRKPAGREEVRALPGDDSALAAANAYEGLVKLISQFDHGRPYASRVAPQFVKLHMSDYDHLARVFEWSTSGEEDGE
ncbi:MAG: double-strand break repair protein AddB [Phenylobacterium sp.]|uniref:double-strand break repair protein AddB n=1 Tax=Phenylobacterium sp. TaxID=1871053 RepID=UPI0025F82585|nr:double-strand break repair protein AddB [Phenylobacterium sp.]MBA4011502.1 double-strand break repair protein AddB [Phenylobacterium sp.]